MWPTWADVVRQEMPNCEFYNLGRGGSGNPLISYRIAEANNRYKFNETDLVMVMFTSYAREDRWLTDESGWATYGNVFFNRYYPEEFTRKYSDERGYLIRDAAVIDMTVNYLENLPGDSFYMLSKPFVTLSENSGADSKVPHDIKDIYSKTFNKFNKSMHELEIAPNIRTIEHDYPFDDGHPTTIRYYNYLMTLGFNLSNNSKQFAEESSSVLKSLQTRNIVPLYFPEQNDNMDKSLKTMF
jgi:hypothetical protein